MESFPCEEQRYIPVVSNCNMPGMEISKVIVSIKDGVVKGEMPGRALKMILEWLEIHREELLSNWEKAQNGMPLDKIEPLN